MLCESGTPNQILGAPVKENIKHFNSCNIIVYIFFSFKIKTSLKQESYLCDGIQSKVIHEGPYTNKQ